MDVVLEIFDTFLFDRLYAAALPASGSAFSVPQALKGNGTYTSMLQQPTGGVPHFSYEPATSYFQLPPSEWAYMSQWPRDNIYRQSISLFAITW